MPNMPTERNLFNSDHGAGKGDKERSSKWRENYPAIEWGVVEPDGFVRVGTKQVKVYSSKGEVPHVCFVCGLRFMRVERLNPEFHTCPTCGGMLGAL